MKNAGATFGSICSSNVAVTVTTSPRAATSAASSDWGDETDTATSAAVSIAGGVLSTATHTEEPGWSKLATPSRLHERAGLNAGPTRATTSATSADTDAAPKKPSFATLVCETVSAPHCPSYAPIACHLIRIGPSGCAPAELSSMASVNTTRAWWYTWPTALRYTRSSASEHVARGTVAPGSSSSFFRRAHRRLTRNPPGPLSAQNPEQGAESAPPSTETRDAKLPLMVASRKSSSASNPSAGFVNVSSSATRPLSSSHAARFPAAHGLYTRYAGATDSCLTTEVVRKAPTHSLTRSTGWSKYMWNTTYSPAFTTRRYMFHVNDPGSA